MFVTVAQVCLALTQEKLRSICKVGQTSLCVQVSTAQDKCGLAEERKGKGVERRRRGFAFIRTRRPLQKQIPRDFNSYSFSSIRSPLPNSHYKIFHQSKFCCNTLGREEGGSQDIHDGNEENSFAVIGLKLTSLGQKTLDLL